VHYAAVRYQKSSAWSRSADLGPLGEATPELRSGRDPSGSGPAQLRRQVECPADEDGHLVAGDDVFGMVEAVGVAAGHALLGDIRDVAAGSEVFGDVGGVRVAEVGPGPDVAPLLCAPRPSSGTLTPAPSRSRVQLARWPASEGGLG